MFIKMKIGRHAGEVIDVQANAARILLDRDMAEDPYAPPTAEAVPAPAAPPARAPVKAAVKVADVQIRRARAVEKANARHERNKQRRNR